jgi:hypothetical protein
MEQDVSRWMPLGIALVAAAAILLRNAQVAKERRSSGQWLIFGLYKVMRFVWALLRGVDVGYLEYRRVLQEAAIEVENERCLGKLIKGRRTEKVQLYDWQQHEA